MALKNLDLKTAANHMKFVALSGRSLSLIRKGARTQGETEALFIVMEAFIDAKIEELFSEENKTEANSS